MSVRNSLKNAAVIVIKIGSSSLTNPSGKLDRENLFKIIKEIAGLIKSGKKIIIVTSGAIVTGREKIKLRGKTISEKQAAAAVGQSLLMKEYHDAFRQFNLTTAQILLTRDALGNRERYINAKHTLTTLLDYEIVPVVNENDTVSTDEIKVGDNDNLSALVASLLGADLLINLTGVEGFLLAGNCLDTVEKITPEIEKAAGPASVHGTGGMVTKLAAAKILSHAGIPLVISCGRTPENLKNILNGEKIGTLFVPQFSKQQSRKRWLAHGLPAKGKIMVDFGAAQALTEKGSSLLSAGVRGVKGKFKTGEAVSIISGGREIARGLTNYNFEELNQIKGLKTAEIEKILGFKCDEVIHRDNLVVL